MRPLLAEFWRRCRGIVGRTAVAQARPFRRGEGLVGGLAETRDLRDKFCARPWDHFEIGLGGKTWMCCPKWLPRSIGNAANDDIMAIWNSRRSRGIRRSILDGSFQHCVQEECPLIQNGHLPSRDAITDPRLRRIIDEKVEVTDAFPLTFNLCYDESCNLRCPSCRRDRILFATGREYDERLRIQQRLVASLFGEPHDRAFAVSITGSGDPFGSPLFRDLLTSIDGADFPNVVFHLYSNGVLFTPDNWARIERLHRNLGTVIVSFDAATAGTYATTRRGGNWNRLIENVAFLSDLRGQGQIRHLALAFVVQHANYREMPHFVELAKGFGAIDAATFSLITDWGTYRPEEFATHAIWRPEHPEFSDFLRVLQNPVFDDRIAHLGNVSAYRERALGA